MIPVLKKVALLNIKYKKGGPHDRCLHLQSYGPGKSIFTDSDLVHKEKDDC